MRNALILAVAMGAMPAFAADTIKLPETRAGRLLGSLIELCNAADEAKLKTWAEQNLSERGLKRIGAEGFARRTASECKSDGGYELGEVKKSEENSITVSAVARATGLHSEIGLFVSPEGKLNGMGTFPTTPPEASLPKDLSDKGIEKATAQLADKLRGLDRFSGVVMVARGSQPLFTHAAGYADGKSKPITPQTQFTLGSMSKMWTAAGLGQLVDQGKLSFDDTVGKIFPEYANKTVRDKVTVGMLLSHRAGMGDFLSKRTPEMMKNGVKRASEFMPLYEKDELQFEPGTRWQYSNAGLALAGAILEKVSGETYPDYIRKHIFAAAGMKNSDPNNIPHVDDKMVTPFTESDDPNAAQHWTAAPRDIGSPAGGGLSTAEDMLKFADALRSGRLVSKATFNQMATMHGETPFGQYGYAMDIENVYGQKVVGHGGGFPGVSTQLYIFPDAPYTAVVLCNYDPPCAENVGNTVRALIAEKVKTGK